MSKATLLTALTIGLVAASTTFADDSAAPQSFQQVVNFVESNLIGKTLESTITSKIADGTIESEVHRRMMFTNLVQVNDTAEFDAISLVRQKLWDLDSNGKRTTDEPRIKNRVDVTRYGVYASKATGEAIGLSSSLTNSHASTIGHGSGIQMRLEDGKLILVHSTPVYSAFMAKGDTYKPGASTVTITFSVADGKLTAETVVINYDVNPKTLERTPTGDEIRFLGSEVPDLF